MREKTQLVSCSYFFDLDFLIFKKKFIFISFFLHSSIHALYSLHSMHSDIFFYNTHFNFIFFFWSWNMVFSYHTLSTKLYICTIQTQYHAWVFLYEEIWILYGRQNQKDNYQQKHIDLLPKLFPPFHSIWIIFVCFTKPSWSQSNILLLSNKETHVNLQYLQITNINCHSQKV